MSTRGLRRIAFAGGGTGGHVYPALAVADRLTSRCPGLEVLFIGTRSGIESRVVPEAGYRLKTIISRGARGRGLAGQALTLASLAAGIVQSTFLLSRFRPDLVFGSGGYASAAAIIAAFAMRKRIVIQEQNSVPGLVNRMLAPLAKRIYLGFAEAAGFLKGHPGAVFTGNPLRDRITCPGGGCSKADFGLSDEGPVLLVFGGSQGARSLNRAAVDLILSRGDMQAIIQTGRSDHGWVSERLSGVKERVFVSEYIEDIESAYGVADVALARAGALSVSELVAVRLPSILVPYPHSADDHQVHNARTLVERGGAVMIMDPELDGESLSDALDRILGDRAGYEAMKDSLARMQPGDAASMIVDDIMSLVDPGGDSGEAAAAGRSGSGGARGGRDAR